ncbi:BrnT family toxin [Asticcacaulis sp. EMRT-3]|uniref:BrnT family toxin n=1 Tax=Asticcacaulis sp. EMRT-3 TaxID=3040349 RepID=UPI0024AE96E3|nr:BrnT family toxin [Asticcacaulis sp. EMRT-3]MDI7774107.1 BrnT family toxin [Asticcacaulis sp. EMRT-3]
MLWTWDEKKAAANLVKHKVPFELAVQVFTDPFQLSEPDPHEGEARWRTIGSPLPHHPLLLFVLHTDNDSEDGRIISARKATPHERKAYENAIR